MAQQPPVGQQPQVGQHPPMGQQSPMGQGLLIHEVSRSHTLRHSTLGRTPLDELSAGCRDLYLTTHNTYNRQTSMPQVEFEPTIPAMERPQIHALDRAATGIGTVFGIMYKN